ncbi:crooked [Dermatophagoides pteronyssinus]|uniref:crooked n=1 Tax=Dermatophagoides pteronyssinus TaxID=6956 RepID=UPI003F67EA02
MNQKYSNILLMISILIFSFQISNVFGIKCWVCHSDSDPKCADPFDNNTLPIKDCREVKRTHLFEDETPYETLIRQDNKKQPELKQATMCRKIRQKIHGNWRTIRDCAFLGSPGEGTGNEHNCLYRKGTYDIYLEYCTCNSKDGCNSSISRFTSSSKQKWLSLFATIMFLIFIQL